MSRRNSVFHNLRRRVRGGRAVCAPPGVHRDIRVFGNTFRGCGAAGVFIASARGVEVRDNIFEDNWRNPPRDADPERRDVRLVNCEDTKVENPSSAEAKP